MLILVLITECKKKSVFKNNGKKAFEKNDKNIFLSKKSWLNNFVLEAYVKKLLKPSAYLINSIASHSILIQGHSDIELTVRAF